MRTESTVRVFIADDLPAVRERLAELIAEIGGAEVVGNAGTPPAAIAGILAAHPDVVLLDVQLDCGTGLDVLRAVHPRRPDIVFVVLTNHVQPQYREAYLRAGARHFFDKTTEFKRIATVLQGQTAETQ